MSSETDKTPATSLLPPAGGIRRGRIGLNVGVQIALGLALFAMINVLGHRRFRQWDHTYNRSFSLAGTTVTFLGQVKEPVRVSVLVGGSGAHESDTHLERDLRPLLDQYRQHLSGRMAVEFIDTTRDVNLWESFKLRLDQRKSGLKISSDGVLVQSDLPRQAGAGSEVYYHKWIPAESLYVIDRERKIATAFRGESLLNTAIAAVTNPERPRVAVVTNMGDLKVQQGLTAGHVLSDICSAQNIDFEGWRMMQNPEDAPNYKALIFIGTEIFQPQQDADLTQFFETPGKSVMVLLDPDKGSDGLDKWLARYGLQPQADRVLYARSTASGAYRQFAVDAHFLGNAAITRGLENRATFLPGKSRSLRLAPGLEKVRSENIQLTPLLSPDGDFWGETNFNEEMPRFDEKEDHGKPLFVAACAERGAANDPRVQMQSSRLVVVGNADLALPPPAAPNYDFLTRALNWMLHREEAAINDSSTDKAKHKFSITIKPEQWKRILLITTIVLPLSALMTGLLIWSTRRH
jgi:hypothetical protein